MELLTLTHNTEPDQFILETDEIFISSQRFPSLETRIPYWNISPSYRKSSPEKESGRRFAVRLTVYLILPSIFLYYSFDTGWILLIIAALFVFPALFEIRKRFQKLRYTITFHEDIDYGYAFHISYFPEEEQKVLEFVKALMNKLESSSDKRKREREESC